MRDRVSKSKGDSADRVRAKVRADEAEGHDRQSLLLPDNQVRIRVRVRARVRVRVS